MYGSIALLFMRDNSLSEKVDEMKGCNNGYFKINADYFGLWILKIHDAYIHLNGMCLCGADQMFL